MSKFIKGHHYRWKSGEQHTLVYLGENWSGNGYWHQFERLDAPGVVWCEVLTRDLHMLTSVDMLLGVQESAEPLLGNPFRNPAFKNSRERRKLAAAKHNAELDRIAASKGGA